MTDFKELKNKKLWLFDMDGTIYLGNKIFNGTLDFFDKIKAHNSKYIFITNNSSSGIDAYLNKVRKMGIEADESNFYTSIDASFSIFKEKFNKELIYAQGTKSFIKNLKNGGLNVTDKYNDNAKCIIVGFDTELTMNKLEQTCKMLLKDIPYYATNPDWVCPTEFGYVPDCGSMCFGLEKASGKKPIFIGKPNSFMIEEVMKKFGVKREETVVVGDRIYTDIASGLKANVDTILVLSGETTLETCKNSSIKPTYIFKDIFEMNKIF